MPILHAVLRNTSKEVSGFGLDFYYEGLLFFVVLVSAVFSLVFGFDWFMRCLVYDLSSLGPRRVFGPASVYLCVSPFSLWFQKAIVLSDPREGRL